MKKTPGVHINRYNVPALSSSSYNKGMTTWYPLLEKLVSTLLKEKILTQSKLPHLQYSFKINDILEKLDNETANEELTNQIRFL